MRDRESVPIHWSILQMPQHPRLHQMKPRSSELHLGLPHKWKGT